MLGLSSHKILLTTILFIATVMAVPAYAVDSPISYQVGFELSLLAQNTFANMGMDNFTLHLARTIERPNAGPEGWRLLAANIHFAPEYLQGEQHVPGITGDRSGLTGDMLLTRLYYDHYALPWRTKEEINGVPILQVLPVASFGIGYNSFGYTDTNVGESYRLNTVTASVGLRLHSELFGFLVVDTPSIETFYYLWKSRPVQGQVGGATITKSEKSGINNFITVGIKLPF